MPPWPCEPSPRGRHKFGDNILGRLLFWLFIILILGLVGLSIYFGFQDVPVEQTVVEKDVGVETLGL